MKIANKKTIRRSATIRQRSDSKSGFSMVEVLVALFVLSLGLLGLAALQTLSFKLNHQSYERTQATLLAYDILDRIRANPRGDYTVTVTVDTDCITASCTADDLAKHDIFHWSKAIAGSLAGATYPVTRTGGLYEVTIGWVENDVPGSLTMRTRP